MLVVDSKEDWERNIPITKILEEKGAKYWVIFNKIDQINSSLGKTQIQDVPYLEVSTLTKSGLGELENKLVELVKASNFDHSGSNMIITNQRQKQAFQLALNSLLSCESLFNEQSPLEIISVELRQAINFLTEIVGGVDTEDILGRIFSKFCIGK